MSEILWILKNDEIGSSATKLSFAEQIGAKRTYTMAEKFLIGKLRRVKYFINQGYKAKDI